jgi:hypothetical protein
MPPAFALIEAKTTSAQTTDNNAFLLMVFSLLIEAVKAAEIL